MNPYTNAPHQQQIWRRRQGRRGSDCAGTPAISCQAADGDAASSKLPCATPCPLATSIRLCTTSIGPRSSLRGGYPRVALERRVDHTARNTGTLDRPLVLATRLVLARRALRCVNEVIVGQLLLELPIGATLLPERHRWCSSGQIREGHAPVPRRVVPLFTASECRNGSDSSEHAAQRLGVSLSMGTQNELALGCEARAPVGTLCRKRITQLTQHLAALLSDGAQFSK
eukprot:3727862-Prymnesium_polylepis.1